MDEQELLVPQVLDEEAQQRVHDAYPVYRGTGLAKFGPSGCLLPADMGPYLKDYYTTPVEEGDIWIVTLPKCGTTWMQELVWLVMNDCDYSTANCLLCPDRYQFLEIGGIVATQVREKIRAGNNDVSKRLHLEDIRERAKPWYVKTHLPLHMCPPDLLQKGKVIYVARNPKDTCISYFNHLKIFGERREDMPLSEFVDLFVRGEVSQLPFFPHVLEAWQKRDHDNLLFVFFEDMKKDLRRVIVQVAKFLGKQLTPEQLDGLQHHLDFKQMKNNPWVNKNMMYAYSPYTAEELKIKAAANERQVFMRKGETGDWKNHLTDEMVLRIDSWTEQELKNSTLSFVTDLNSAQEKVQS